MINEHKLKSNFVIHYHSFWGEFPTQGQVNRAYAAMNLLGMVNMIDVPKKWYMTGYEE